jgi:hypothetical protein
LADFSAKLWQIDALVRIRTEPAFELDAALLEATLNKERQRRRASDALRLSLRAPKGKLVIVAGWRVAGDALRHAASGLEAGIAPWGLVHTSAGGLRLPSGRVIHYPDLRQEETGQWPDGRVKRQWVYADGRNKTLLTGPKVVENMVQALARDSIFECCLDFYQRAGLRPALRVHDELVYVMDAHRAGALLDELQAVMRTPPRWWPQLVVWSEGAAAPSYGQAK